MTKWSNAADDTVLVEVSHRDALVETIEKLEKRGFEPVLIAFRDPSGEVEVLSRGVDLQSFASWLATTWIPSSRHVGRERGKGH